MLPIAQRKFNVLLLTALVFMLFACDKSEGDFGDNKGPGSGKGGSMARFTVACNHLYVVDESSLHVMSLADPSNPTFVKKIDIGFGIETIFPFGNYLLIGSSTGMFIYSLSDCANPTYISQFAHVMACDPVVAEGNYAYVTLRSGGDCRTGWTANQLDIINISNVYLPQLIETHPVPEPWGLGIDNKTLFICHGDNGLGVYNVANPAILNTIHLFPNIKSYDVIPHNSILLVTGPGGIYQYDYSDLNNLVLLSTITVP
jgi:hypothetical protein